MRSWYFKDLTPFDEHLLPPKANACANPQQAESSPRWKFVLISRCRPSRVGKLRGVSLRDTRLLTCHPRTKTRAISFVKYKDFCNVSRNIPHAQNFPLCRLVSISLHSSHLCLGCLNPRRGFECIGPNVLALLAQHPSAAFPVVVNSSATIKP